MHALLTLLLASAWAQTQAPPSPPPAQTPPHSQGSAALKRAVDPFEAGLIQPLPVTPELLDRWEIPVERYLQLSPPEKLEVQKDLTLRELGRLRKLELLRRAASERCSVVLKADCSESWKAYVTPKGLLTPEGLRLVSEYEARLKEKPLLVPVKIDSLERADGKQLTAEDLARARVMLDRMFEGSVERRDAPGLGSDLVFDARFRNETLHSLTMTNTKTGTTLEVGQLGIDGRHPLLAPSWYGNVTQRWESKPESWVDYRVHAQLGYVDLRARYFNDEPDPRVDRVLELGRRLGVPDDRVRELSQYVTYDDAYKAHGIIVTSLLTELGRAYNLFGPVDVSWTFGNLTRVMHLAPNTAFDETLGIRVRLADDKLNLGFFGGATQNMSPVSNQLLRQSLTGGVKAGFDLENAPHATVALWGQAPGLSDVQFMARASQRFNRDTTASEGELALMTTFRDRPLTLRGIYSRERGGAIEYDREKLRAQLGYQVSPNAEAFLAFEKDRIRFGNAEVDSNAFLAGFQVNFGGGRGTITMDHVFGGEYEGRSPLRTHFQDALDKVNRAAVNAVEVADRAFDLYNGLRGDLAPGALEAGMNRLAFALTRLGPDGLPALIDEISAMPLTDAQRATLTNLVLRTLSPDSPYYAQLRDYVSSRAGGWSQEAGRIVGRFDDAAAWYGAHRGDILELARLLTDETVLDAFVVRAGRAALIKALDKGTQFTIPLLDKEMHIALTGPVIIAAANTLGSRLSPVAPVRREDVEPWLLRMAGEHLGLGGDVTEEMLVAKLFDMGEAELRRYLQSNVAPRLDDLLNRPYDPAQVAARVLSSLPGPVADALRQRYGASLEGLLPQSLPAGQVRDFLLNQLPGRLVDFLQREFSDDVARQLAKVVTWAGDILRREMNMAMIQIMLASEELNRLTVDKGLKIGDLNVRMAMASFEKLDARTRRKAETRIHGSVQRLAREAGQEEAHLAERLKEHGRESLSRLQLDPSWPQGLRIDVPEESWPGFIGAFGDGPFFEMIGRMRERYQSNPRPGGLVVQLVYELKPSLGGGTSIWTSKQAPHVKIVLSHPKDERDAALKLRYLEDYVAEAPKPAAKPGGASGPGQPRSPAKRRGPTVEE